MDEETKTTIQEEEKEGEGKATPPKNQTRDSGTREPRCANRAQHQS